MLGLHCCAGFSLVVESGGYSPAVRHRLHVVMEPGPSGLQYFQHAGSVFHRAFSTYGALAQCSIRASVLPTCWLSV